MMQRRSALAFVLTAAMLAACGGGDDMPPAEQPMQRVAAFWPITTLDETYVVRSDAEWQVVWARHEPPTIPPTERPRIDFSREMVVGLTRGTGADGCHGLMIVKVIEHAEALRVEYVVSRPSASSICTMSLVPLTDFVAVPATAKPVRFVERTP